MHDPQKDPRTRKSRHELTPHNLSSTIRFTDIPAQWNKDNFTSVITGSGYIVDVREKYVDEVEEAGEREGGKGTGAGAGAGSERGCLEWVDVDFRDSSSANRAQNSINKINHFPCRMSMVIPKDWKEKLEKMDQLKPLEFTRDNFPWDYKLELPFEMVSEVPLPRKPLPVVQPITSDAGSTLSSENNTASTNAASDNLASKANEAPAQQIEIPEILARASKHLPAYQPGSMTAPDVVSQNLSKIPTLQMIEILSNLKILANQHNKKPQLEQFLKTNIDLTVAVTQAMLEMGLINYHVISNVLGQMQGQHSVGPTPAAAAPTVPTLPPVQLPEPSVPQTAQGINSGGNGTGGDITTTATTNAANTPQQFNEAKLSLLPQDQQNMIRTALSMPITNIMALPPGQQQLIQQLKNDYLL